MPQAPRRCRWRWVAFAAAICVIADPTANAKDSLTSVKNADQYLAKGNPKAAEIELLNAVRDSPENPVIRARLADVFFQLGDFASAEREARAARARNGNEADYLPVFADALLRQYKFGAVLNLIQPGNRNPIFESKVRLALGTAAAAVHDWDRAEAMLRDATRLDRSAAKPKFQLARFLNGKNPDEANKLIDEAIAADPRSSEAVEVKGEMLRARGERDGAMRFFDEALRIDPKNLVARLSRADLNIAREQFKTADEDLDQILKENPNNFMANYLHALELVKQQQYAKADQICDRLSSVFAMFPAGYYLQGVTKLALGQFAQAEGILSKYLSYAPGDPRAVRLIASAALQQHAAPRAIDYLKPLVDKLPAEAATLTALGNAYMADGNSELALRQFEKAAAIDPKNPAIKTGVAISMINTGQGEQGLSQLEQVFASESGATVAGPTLVLTHLRAGHVDKAAADVASLIKRDANNPLYLRLLGAVRAAQHDYAGAETAFRAALARDPEFAVATRDLAQLYLTTGRTDDAKRVYTERLSKKADDVIALLGLADIAIAEKKWSEATDAINRARTAAEFDPAPGLKLVSLYELRRDWDSAKVVADELGTRFPRDVNVVEAQGRVQFEAGDTEGAIASYKFAHELMPDSAPILSRYVALLNQAKYFREARAVLQDAVASDPQNASSKVDLIRVEAEIDGLDAALAQARDFAKKDPDNNLYDLVSAELYEKAGRAGDAIALLEKAVAARPSDDSLTVALSRLYMRTGDFVKAEVVLTTRLTTDPKNIAVGSALAPVYVTTGRPNDAKKIYSDLLSQRPNDVAALIGLADIAIAEKKWLEATDYITRARAAAPNDPAPGLTLINLYALRQHWKSALATTAELAEKFPANVDVLDTQARVQVEAGDTDGAAATYKRAHELAPNSLPILSRYLIVLKAAKNFAEAQTVLQAAIDRDPQNASLKADMVRVEAEIGGLDAALAKARSFANSDPASPLYDLVSAELYEKAGRSREAVALLENAVAVRSSDNRLTTALSRLYTHMGEPVKAETVLSNRLKADPKDFAIRSALASFYFEQKSYASAFAEYSGLIDDHPTDAAALNNLAWLYQQRGNLAKARELAERAFAISPRSAEIGDTLGWILLAQGEADKALTYLSAANLSAPRNPDIQYHLAVALHSAGRPADAQTVLENLLASGISFADKAEAEKLLRELKPG